jgi:hypothetical protein
MTASSRTLMMFVGGAVVGICLGAATMIALSSTERAGTQEPVGTDPAAALHAKPV